MFRYLIDCLQYKRELTLHRTLTSLHSTSCHFTSLPPCISPASNDLRTGIIISYCDAKITCKRHLFAPHHHDVQPPRHSIPLSTTNTTNPLPSSSNLIPNQSDSNRQSSLCITIPYLYFTRFRSAIADSRWLPTPTAPASSCIS
jgi:hypothetical protein